MNYSLTAQNLCDELYTVLTGKHGFTMVADSYGWEPGYMIIDWRTSVANGVETIDPDNLEELGSTIQNIAGRHGYQLIKLQGETQGYGNFYFKSFLIEEKKVEYNF